jgi:hypothetical protein
MLLPQFLVEKISSIDTAAERGNRSEGHNQADD